MESTQFFCLPCRLGRPKAWPALWQDCLEQKSGRNECFRTTPFLYAQTQAAALRPFCKYKRKCFTPNNAHHSFASQKVEAKVTSTDHVKVTAAHMNKLHALQKFES